MIGERLLNLRKDAELTQDELAVILNINKHSISSYERNKSEPPDEIKIAIAKHFNVSTDYLLGLSDNPAPISQQEKVIRLPEGFPENGIKELRNYIGYIMYKKNTNEKRQ